MQLDLVKQNPTEIVGHFFKIAENGVVEWLRETTLEEETLAMDFALCLYNVSPWIVASIAAKLVPDIQTRKPEEYKARNQILSDLAKNRGMALSTIKEYRKIFLAFGPAQISAALTYTHYKLVYDNGADHSWLTKAEQNKLTCTEMLRQIQASKLPPPQDPKPEESQEPPDECPMPTGSVFESDPPGPTPEEMENFESDGGGHCQGISDFDKRDHSWAADNVRKAAVRLLTTLDTCQDIGMKLPDDVHHLFNLICYKRKLL